MLKTIDAPSGDTRGLSTRRVPWVSSPASLAFGCCRGRRRLEHPEIGMIRGPGVDESLAVSRQRKGPIGLETGHHCGRDCFLVFVPAWHENLVQGDGLVHLAGKVNGLSPGRPAGSELLGHLSAKECPLVVTVRPDCRDREPSLVIVADNQQAGPSKATSRCRGLPLELHEERWFAAAVRACSATRSSRQRRIQPRTVAHPGTNRL